MRYYIIGNKNSSVDDYNYAEKWLKLNGHSVINPFDIRIKGITDSELTQIKLQLLSFSDSVLVLDKSCDTYELSCAKALGKKVKYLSKQWKLKRKESRDLYNGENTNGWGVDHTFDDVPAEKQNELVEKILGMDMSNSADKSSMTIISNGKIYNVKDFGLKKENNND